MLTGWRTRAAEGVTLEAGSMEGLSRVSNGDLRKAITTLQSAVRLKGPQVRHTDFRPVPRTFRRYNPVVAV